MILKRERFFSKDNLWVKRPGTGEILAEEFESILGKKANNDISSGQQLNEKIFNNKSFLDYKL